jgi:hypothetical protein
MARHLNIRRRTRKRIQLIGVFPLPLPMAVGCPVPLKRQTAILCSRTTAQQGPDIREGRNAADMPSVAAECWPLPSIAAYGPAVAAAAQVPCSPGDARG